MHVVKRHDCLGCNKGLLKAQLIRRLCKRPTTRRVVGSLGVCVCGVTECPVTTLSVFQQGRHVKRGQDHPFAVCDGPTKRPQQMRISRLITSTYLCISCDSKSFWPVVSLAVCASC